MLDREPNKESEKYLEEKFEKIWSLAVLVCKKGKLTSLAVQNPCSIPKCSLNIHSPTSKVPCKVGIFSCGWDLGAIQGNKHH
jgi:hypothetical protein